MKMCLEKYIMRKRWRHGVQQNGQVVGGYWRRDVEPIWRGGISWGSLEKWEDQIII